MTVGELISFLNTLDERLPVLAWYPPTEGYANALVRIINQGTPRPYVVIDTMGGEPNVEEM